MEGGKRGREKEKGQRRKERRHANKMGGGMLDVCTGNGEMWGICGLGWQ
jgi:hypothetical protein